MVLSAENHRLRGTVKTAASPGPGGQAFDIPRTAHEWHLAQRVSTGRPRDLYDIRPDDAVIFEGQRGQELFDKFFVIDAAPDFSGAVSALNSHPPQDYHATLDASIVIPVYGQLPYTLNCIDSLLLHRSRYSFEIIVIDDVSPDETAQFLPLVDGIRYYRQPRNGGFIKSCNAGASLANGRFIVMLNNDTRVVEGWLDELLDSFTLWPRAGLVGSKLFYHDGSLQEAGGIIWRDGSSWNYGRNDDPNRPQYCYARQVDYISGCSIALPRELWDDLDGFDELFMPAYCEDADLALRVCAAGKQVWFQPRSRIIHYEGKTSGTDTGNGTKAYQVINSKKLFLRWRERLSIHRPNAVAPFFERERQVAKRLLVVDVSTPTPNQDAGSVQTFMALRCALALDYKVHFVPEDNWLFQPDYTVDLQRIGVDCAYAPYELGFEAYMNRYGWLFDAVLVYRPSVLERCLPVIRDTAPQAAVLFHVADLHYLRMERTAALNDDQDLWQAAAAMKLREQVLVEAADCTITHSEVENTLLCELSGQDNIVTWPLMVDFFGTDKLFPARKDICFLGGYGHPPNIDAVLYFVEEIFPLLRKAEPGIRFLIAGSRMPDEIRALACEDIVTLGMIDDLRDLFDPCRVFVCPLRAGAGVKGKVASAMSYGIPVVSTDIGVEGAGLCNGSHVLVANGAEAFAEAVLRLYRDKALWTSISDEGQRFVKDNLSTAMGGRVLAQAIDIAHAHRLGLDEDTRQRIETTRSTVNA